MQSEDLFRNRKFQVLAGLLLLLVIVNITEWRQSKGVSSGQQQKAKSSKSESMMGDPTLLADKLAEEKLEFQQEKRNIFTFSDGSEADPSFEEMAGAEPPPPPDPV